MPKRYTMFDFQKQNKSVYFFQRGKGNSVKTLEVYNVRTLEVYNVKTLEVYNVRTLEVYNLKTLEVYNVKTLEVYSIKHSLEVMYVQTQYRAHVNILYSNAGIHLKERRDDTISFTI